MMQTDPPHSKHIGNNFHNFTIFQLQNARTQEEKMKKGGRGENTTNQTGKTMGGGRAGEV